MTTNHIENREMDDRRSFSDRRSNSNRRADFETPLYPRLEVFLERKNGRSITHCNGAGDVCQFLACYRTCSHLD